MSKQTARIVVAVIGAGLVFHVLADMLGRHYYRATYGFCLRAGPLSGPLCESWTLQALLEILAIATVAAGLWIYNERRPEAPRS